MSTVLRIALWVMVGFFVLTPGTCALALGTRYYLTVSRIDATDQPPPSWLPARSTQVAIRGTQAFHRFTGRCSCTELEAWAADRHIPLKRSDPDTVRVYDMRRAPMEWRNHMELRAESLEIELEGKNALTWEKRADDGGGITLIFDTTTDTFYGDRSLW